MAVRKRLSLLRYLALVSFAGVGILLLVELVAWGLSPGRFADPPAVTADAWISSDALAPSDTVWLKEFVEEFCLSYHAHWSSYVYYRRDPFSGMHINVDTNGIRSTVPWGLRHTENGPPARVVLLGGSTMWGTGSRDSGTIPSALARLIGSDAGVRPAAVVNLGESGYVSTQSLLGLELELRKGNVPDIVILYDGVNDIYSAFQNGEPGLPQNEANRGAEFNLLKDGGRMRRLGIHDLFARTVTASLLHRVRTAISSPPPPPAPRSGLAEEIVRIYRGNLDIMEALSRQYGFRYEAYWQPVVFTRAEPSRYEQRQSDLQQQVRPFFLEVYSRVAQDPTLRHNTHFHNLGGVFDATGIPVYIDFCHISETGNAIIARRMYSDIRSSLIVPDSPLN